MRSQVSFNFDGQHNVQAVKDILKQRIPDVRTFISKTGTFVYRCYVASPSMDEISVLNICRGIQNHALLSNHHTFN